MKESLIERNNRAVFERCTGLVIPSELNQGVQDRISELLGQSNFESNCHGAIIYVLGIKNPSLASLDHPTLVDADDMERILERDFKPTGQIAPGNLLCFFKKIESEIILMHSALAMRTDALFEQTGPWGTFRIGMIKDRLRSLEAFDGEKRDNIIMRSYELAESSVLL